MIGPRTRRALLRTGALAVAGLAGCVGDSGDATDDRTSTATEESHATAESSSAGATAEATDGTTTDEAADQTTDETAAQTTAESPAIELVPKSVQTSFFYHTTPDSMDVAAVEGTQFAFVEARPRTDAPSFENWPSPDDFALVADGDRYPATLTPGPIHDPYTFYQQGRVYDPDRGRGGWLAFEVPNPLDARDVVVAYDDHEQTVDGRLRAELRAPPADFELVSFDAPDRVAPDEFFDVSIAVRNAGERDGTFRACLNQSGPTYAPHRAEFPVSAGERREWVWSFGQHVSDGTARVKFRFRSAVADRETAVEVAPETTTQR